MSTASIEPPIDTISSNLTEWPSHSHALSLLHSLAQAITPLLLHHPSYQINSLQEFFPDDPALNGAFESSPTGDGHNIFVRLRRSEDYTKFHPLGFVVDAALEQLAGIKGGDVQRVWDGLRGEYTGSREYDGVRQCVGLRKMKKREGSRAGRSKVGSVASTLRANSRNQLAGYGSRGPRSQVTAASTARFPPSNAPRSMASAAAPSPSVRSSTSRYPPSAAPRSMAPESVRSSTSRRPPSSSRPPISTRGRDRAPQSSASRPPLSTRGRQQLDAPPSVSRPPSRATSRARSSARTAVVEPWQMDRLADALNNDPYDRALIYSPRRATSRAPSRAPSHNSSRYENNQLVHIDNSPRSINPPESYYGPPSTLRPSSRAGTLSSRRSASRAGTLTTRHSSSLAPPSRRSNNEQQPQNVSVQNVNIYNFGERGSSSRVEQSLSSRYRESSRQSVTIDMGSMTMGGMTMGGMSMGGGSMTMGGTVPMGMPAMPARARGRSCSSCSSSSGSSY